MNKLYRNLLFFVKEKEVKNKKSNKDLKINIKRSWKHIKFSHYPIESEGKIYRYVNDIEYKDYKVNIVELEEPKKKYIGVKIDIGHESV